MTAYFKLTDKNFIMFSTKAYKVPIYTDSTEFYEDLDRIKYIKKLITRYLTSGVAQHQLLQNHVIILSNQFGILNTIRMLLLKCDTEHHPTLKSVFMSLQYISDFNVEYIKRCDCINIHDIQHDENILEILRKL